MTSWPNNIMPFQKILAIRIIQSNLYRDAKSIEKTTATIKPKLKLAGKPLRDLDLYFFNVLTSSSASCKQKCTLCIELADWENVVDWSFFREKSSYCDLTKFELMDASEVINKINDGKNGFPCIARLRAEKYRKLQSLREVVLKLPYVSDATKEIVGTALSEEMDEKLEKLGLK